MGQRGNHRKKYKIFQLNKNKKNTTYQNFCAVKAAAGEKVIALDINVIFKSGKDPNQ